MAFVNVPKDLTRVKNKVILNLTKRQIFCFSIAAAIGLPFYFLASPYIGTSNAATGMVVLMLPAFLFAMYEKDGLPLEKVLMNIISTKYLRPGVRKYEMTNLYDHSDRKDKRQKGDRNGKEKPKAKRRRSKKKA